MNASYVNNNLPPGYASIIDQAKARTESPPFGMSVADLLARGYQIHREGNYPAEQMVFMDAPTSPTGGVLQWRLDDLNKLIAEKGDRYIVELMFTTDDEAPLDTWGDVMEAMRAGLVYDDVYLFSKRRAFTARWAREHGVMSSYTPYPDRAIGYEARIENGCVVGIRWRLPTALRLEEIAAENTRRDAMGAPKVMLNDDGTWDMLRDRQQFMHWMIESKRAHRRDDEELTAQFAIVVCQKEP